MKTNQTPGIDDAERFNRPVVSRHLDIPPTPRDTLAVLRQAAELQQAKAAAPTWLAGFLRGAAALAAIALIAGATLYLRQTDAPVAVSVAVDQDSDLEDADLGVDVAAWDVEFAALLDDVDASLESFDDAWVLQSESSL